MEILSLEFVVFVLASLVVYYLLPGRLQIGESPSKLRAVFKVINSIAPSGLQNLFLLAVSYYFYYTHYTYQPYILLASTLINFGLGHWLYRSTRFKRHILWLGILLNAMGLLWFLIGSPILLKSLNVSSLNINETLDLFPYIILPVGFSYYTLNGISYLLDINLKVAKPTTNFIDFALYLSWFPKIINGPLERARKFLPQLAEKRIVDNQAIAHSLLLILIGTLRMAILGGLFAIFIPAKSLTNPASFGNPALLWGMISFMFYLYNQFAGYSDIARGVSGLFGIPLSRNFAWPFFSKDFSDFWQRWHISLSSWLRDYVYMPLSRAFLRKNPSRTNVPNLIVPPLVTMFISGLWHGAKPNLIVWGVMMGLLIMFENIRMLSRPAVPAASVPLWRRIISKVPLLALMLIATVPFSMELKDTLVFYRQLILGWDWGPFDLRPLFIPVLSLLVDWIQYRSNDEAVFLKWPVWVQSFLIASVVLGAIVIDQLQSAPPVFVYP